MENIKQVGHAFLSEMHFVIIDDETGNAHDIIFLFKVWIVLEIIDVGRYIFIIRGNTLRPPLQGRGTLCRKEIRQSSHREAC